MRKGYDGNQIITVLSNLGAAGNTYTFTLPNTGFRPGQVVIEVLTCTRVTVDGNSNVAVAMGAGLPRVSLPIRSLSMSVYARQPALDRLPVRGIHQQSQSSPLANDVSSLYRSSIYSLSLQDRVSVGFDQAITPLCTLVRSEC